jgi:Tfp pilus assembly protein FimV
MLEPTLHKLMDEVDEMAARKGDAGQTATASLHNPANQMDAEQSAPAPQPTATTPTAPQDPLTAILAGITNLTTKMEGFESRLMAVERGETPARAKPATDPRNRPAPPIPPRPTLKQGPKGILINAIPRAPPKVPPRPHNNRRRTTATGDKRSTEAD